MAEPGEPVIVDDSRKEFGYRQALLAQTDRIAQVITFLRNSGEQAVSYRIFENALDTLEALLFPYLDDYYKKPKFSRLVSGDKTSYEKIYAERMQQFQELMALMSRKNLLLKESVSLDV